MKLNKCCDTQTKEYESMQIKFRELFNQDLSDKEIKSRKDTTQT